MIVVCSINTTDFRIYLSVKSSTWVAEGSTSVGECMEGSLAVVGWDVNEVAGRFVAEEERRPVAGESHRRELVLGSR